MTAKRTNNAWREKISLAAITGLISGAARALVAWALDHLH
jgi:hypothetical protein